LSKWIKQYGREEILPKRVKVETMSEIDELQAARKRIRELEAAQDVSAHGLLSGDRVSGHNYYKARKERQRNKNAPKTKNHRTTP
jgi:hypothetical protein